MKKITYITLVFLLIGIFFVLNMNNNVLLERVKVNTNYHSNVTLAMFVENDMNEYEQIENTNTFPLDTHELNMEKTICIDNAGNKIDNIIFYDENNKKIVIESDNTVSCHLYFDIIYTSLVLFNYGSGKENWTAQNIYYPNQYSTAYCSSSIANSLYVYCSTSVCGAGVRFTYNKDINLKYFNRIKVIFNRSGGHQIYIGFNGNRIANSNNTVNSPYIAEIDIKESGKIYIEGNDFWLSDVSSMSFTYIELYRE